MLSVSNGIRQLDQSPMYERRRPPNERFRDALNLAESDTTDPSWQFPCRLLALCGRSWPLGSTAIEG